jgi:hypothetical protein
MWDGFVTRFCDRQSQSPGSFRVGFVMNSVIMIVFFTGTSAFPSKLPRYECYMHTYSTGEGTVSNTKGLNPPLPQELDCVSLSRYTLPGGGGGATIVTKRRSSW